MKTVTKLFAIASSLFFEIVFSCKAQPQIGCNDLIINGNFNLFDSVCVKEHNNYTCENPFNAGCIEGWNASHGTPNFFPENPAAIMGVIKSGGRIWGEGIFQTMKSDVEAGKKYLLSFDYENYNYKDFEYELFVQLTNEKFNAGACFEMLPVEGSNIFQQPLKSAVMRTSAHQCFIPDQNYKTIFFFLKTEASSPQWVLIDNISLHQMNDDDNPGCWFSVFDKNKGETMNQDPVIIFPNPCDEKLFLKVHATYLQKMFVEIYYSIGEMIFRREIFSENVEIDMSQFPAGLYTICVTANQFRVVKKIIH